MSDTDVKGRDGEGGGGGKGGGNGGGEGGGGVSRVVGCGAVVALLLGGWCFVGLAGGVRILAEPPAFHNFVYRNDRMLFHSWRLDGFVRDGAGAAAAVDLHREYVLCVLSDDPKLGGAVGYSIGGPHYSIEFSPGLAVSGDVQPRTIEVVDARTGKRTSTTLGAGDAFEWKAEIERARHGEPPKADFRAILKTHGVPLP